MLRSTNNCRSPARANESAGGGLVAMYKADEEAGSLAEAARLMRGGDSVRRSAVSTKLASSIGYPADKLRGRSRQEIDLAQHRVARRAVPFRVSHARTGRRPLGKLYENDVEEAGTRRCATGFGCRRVNICRAGYQGYSKTGRRGALCASKVRHTDARSGGPFSEHVLCR